MRIITTPGYIETHLAEDMGADIGGQGSDDVGNAIADLESSTPSGDPSGTTDEPISEVYYEFDYGEKDGESRKGSFKTEQEMKDWYRENYMMHKDYTKKTTSVSERNKSLEEQQKKFDAEQTAYLAMSNEYRDWDSKFDKLGHTQKAKIAEIINGHREVSPEMKAMQDRIDAIDNEKKTTAENTKKEEAKREQERLLEQTNSYLAKQYPGYDSKAVYEKVQKMRSTTDEQKLTSLLKAVHLADLYEKQQNDAPATRSPLSGGARPQGPNRPVEHKTDDEARAAAIKDLTG